MSISGPYINKGYLHLSYRNSLYDIHGNIVDISTYIKVARMVYLLKA
jgi:hypothetical protein